MITDEELCERYEEASTVEATPRRSAQNLKAAQREREDRRLGAHRRGEILPRDAEEAPRERARSPEGGEGGR